MAQNRKLVFAHFKQLRIPYRCGVPRILILEGKVGGVYKAFSRGVWGMSN